MSFSGGASSSLGTLVFCFPAALTPIRASHRSESSNVINAIRWKRNLGRGHSKPTVRPGFDSDRTRLGKGLRRRSKVLVSLGLYVGAARPPCDSPSPRLFLNG